MAPYVWNKIDWNFVFKLLIRNNYWLTYRSLFTKVLTFKMYAPNLSCILVIFFSFLLMKGYENKKIYNNYGKIFTGIISGTLNGLTTLGGMPVALFLLVTSIQPAVIRGSLAALFFLTDIYAFVLSFLAGILKKTAMPTLPLIIILPIGVYIGDKFFVKSKEETLTEKLFFISLYLFQYLGF